mmetsp:Transcript_28499/g.80271  ORF Transcript_28499/g.80271 Transcript_28499/m.80271 type:complete len:280 (+) Transcript_28499:2502-3341(+)
MRTTRSPLPEVLWRCQLPHPPRSGSDVARASTTAPPLPEADPVTDLPSRLPPPCTKRRSRKSACQTRRHRSMAWMNSKCGIMITMLVWLSQQPRQLWQTTIATWKSSKKTNPSIHPAITVPSLAASFPQTKHPPSRPNGSDSVVPSLHLTDSAAAAITTTVAARSRNPCVPASHLHRTSSLTIHGHHLLSRARSSINSSSTYNSNNNNRLTRSIMTTRRSIRTAKRRNRGTKWQATFLIPWSCHRRTKSRHRGSHCECPPNVVSPSIARRASRLTVRNC